MAKSERDEYRSGYDDATDQIKSDLAAILRLEAVSVTASDEPLTDRRVRDIFAGVFGVKATDDEFGPEPSGKGVRALVSADALPFA